MHMKIKLTIEGLIIGIVSVLLMTSTLKTQGLSWGLFTIPVELSNAFIYMFTLYGSIKMTEYLYRPIRWLLMQSSNSKQP